MEKINHITIPVVVMGKPRMTQRDKWAKRPAVMRYRALADEMRLRVGNRIPEDVIKLSVIAWLPIPKSWSKRKKAEMEGQLHRSRPDADNILKSCGDILFKEDSVIAIMYIEKRWDDGKGPRVRLEWE